MKNKEEIKKLYIFDMDDTLVKNPDRDECQRVWKEKFGIDWPHKGVFSKPESLDYTIFEIPTIPHVIEHYDKIKNDNSVYTVLLTGRRNKLDKEVKALLGYKNIVFDEYLLNNMGDTMDFKLHHLQRLSEEFPNIEEMHFFEDRIEHIPHFKNWGIDRMHNKNCKFTLHQVVEEGFIY